MRIWAGLLFTTLLSISSQSFAKDFSIYPLKSEDQGNCELNDTGDMTETGWLTADGICVLPLMHYAPDSTEKIVPSPKIKINSTVFSLEEISKESSELNKVKTEITYFQSKQKDIKVKLETWLENDSCDDPGNEEKCCGQLYKGNLYVTKNGKTKIYIVQQWHGM